MTSFFFLFFFFSFFLLFFCSSKEGAFSSLANLNLETRFQDFTLYFLAFNHDGKELTSEEKSASIFTREGPFFIHLGDLWFEA